MSNLISYYEYSVLSTAAYVDLNDLDGAAIAAKAIEDKRLPKALADQTFDEDSDQAKASGSAVWTVPQNGYKGNDSAGFAATLFERTQDGVTEKVLAIRGTEPNSVFNAYTDLLKADLQEIGEFGMAITQAVSLYNFVQCLMAPGGKNDVLQLEIHTGLIPPNPAQHSGDYVTAPGVSPKFIWVTRSYTGEGLGLINYSDNLTITGHSLGGHLAAIGARLFPSLFNNGAVTFNAPGHDPDLGLANLYPGTGMPTLGKKLTDEFINKLFAPYLDDPPASSFVGRVVTIESEDAIPGDDWDGVSGNGTGKPFTTEQYIATEKVSHDIGHLMDGLAIQALMARMNDSLTAWHTGKMVEASSAATGESYEALLEKLTKAIQGESVTVERTEPGVAMVDAGDFDARRDYYEKLVELEKAVKDNPGLKLETLIGPDPSTLVSLAQGDSPEAMAYRYALKELNPFVIIGADYGKHNQNGELDLYDPNTGTGTLTGQYLTDRARFLNWHNQSNTEDKTNISDGGPDQWAVQDRNLQGASEHLYYSLDINSGLLGLTGDARKMIFGRETGDDNLLGGAKSDRLYSGGGNDTLTGGEGADYLEGGPGFDGYFVGDGHDTVLDSDGLGRVYFGNDTVPLSGGSKAHGQNYWISPDGQHTYRIESRDLIVNNLSDSGNSLCIEEFQNGDLGISLTNEFTTLLGRSDGVYAAVAGNGDDVIHTLDKDDFILAGSGNDIVYAGPDNDLVFGDNGNDTLYGQTGLDLLRGDTGDDLLFGGDGNDLLEGSAGNDTLIADNGIEDTGLPGAAGQGDWLNGGTGNDILYGSARDDFLAGGAGRDILMGGAGNDVLTGDGEYNPFYAFNNFPVLNLTAVQMQFEIAALHASVQDYNGLWNEALFTLYQLQGGETFFPTEPGLVGINWNWSNTKNIFERSAPSYQVSPKPEAHVWTITVGEDGGLSLASQVARINPFASAATGGGADTLEGGQGNDTLCGGTGGDTYHFSLGDGTDTVHDRLAEGDNLLSFGAGIRREDIRVTEEGNGLKVAYGDGGDAILLPGANAEDAVFRQVRLSDGAVFDFSELLADENQAPETAGAVSGQTGQAGEEFVSILPESLFADPDGDALDYAVTLANGDPLPAWLAFDPATRTLTGTPSNSDIGQLQLCVTATDPMGESASQGFALEITSAGGGDPQLPATAPDSAEVQEDDQVTGNVLANDTKPGTVTGFRVDGDAAAYHPGDTAILTEGALTLAGNGDYRFTPTPDYAGAVPRVTYTTSTGSGSTLDIVVTPVADTPSIAIELGEPTGSGSFTIDTGNHTRTDRGFTVQGFKANGDPGVLATFGGGFGVGRYEDPRENPGDAAGEISYNPTTGASEKLVVTFDNPVTSASVALRQLNSQEYARVAAYDGDNHLVFASTVLGKGSDVDTPVTIETDEGTTISRIEFTAPGMTWHTNGNIKDHDDFVVRSIHCDSLTVRPIQAITVTPTDTDHSEQVTGIALSIPDGVRLSAGTNHDDGTWTLPMQDEGDYVCTVDPVTGAVRMTGLEMWIAPGFIGEATIEVTATVIDRAFVGQNTLEDTGGFGSAMLRMGGSGDDILAGGEWDDLYVFSKGDGRDIIHDSLGSNRLRFLDVKSDEVTLLRSGDDLRILYGESDMLTIQDHFSNASYQMASYAFVDATLVGVDLIEAHGL